jgi:hypothetical protein
MDDLPHDFSLKKFNCHTCGSRYPFGSFYELQNGFPLRIAAGMTRWGLAFPVFTNQGRA